ncbi:MAG: hypothetical protein IKN65_00385 [Clostridia bacterium]|nr:hypothetical protein [Clostridia bacterium]
MIKNLLQNLLKNNSESLFELYDSFVKTFPDESGIHNLLRDYVFSENPMDTKELEEVLTNKLKGKV